MDYIQPERIFCYKTTTSTSRAYARIWSFPKIFQQALDIEPAYVIEVLGQRYDKLSEKEQVKVLIHELLHIPKNFSGSLRPHKFGKTTINREVAKLFKQYESMQPDTGMRLFGMKLEIRI